jgi:hypothetical protein
MTALATWLFRRQLHEQAPRLQRSARAARLMDRTGRIEAVRSSGRQAGNRLAHR